MNAESDRAYKRFSQSVAEALTWIYEPNGKYRRPMARRIRLNVLDAIREDLRILEEVVGPHDLK